MKVCNQCSIRAQGPGEGPSITINNDPEILAKVSGRIDYREGPLLKRAHTKLRRGSFDSTPLNPVHNAAAEPVAPQPAPPRSGTFDAVSPDRLEEKAFLGQTGKARFEIGVRHDSRTRRSVPVFVVVAPVSEQGKAFEGGIPLEVLGLPVVSGMRIEVTVAVVK